MRKLTLIVLMLTFGVTLFAQDLTLSQLNRKVQELERRIQLLEKVLASQSTAPSHPNDRQVPANKQIWRQLKKGMSQEEVKKLLGEPDRVAVMGSITTWFFSTSQIMFDNDGLYSWFEP
jgi:hypothetical protein